MEYFTAYYGYKVEAFTLLQWYCNHEKIMGDSLNKIWYHYGLENLSQLNTLRQIIADKGAFGSHGQALKPVRYFEDVVRAIHDDHPLLGLREEIQGSHAVFITGLYLNNQGLCNYHLRYFDSERAQYASVYDRNTMDQFLEIFDLY